MCYDCKRFDQRTMTCEAYPDGIPQEIFDNEWDHRLPKPGDHGIQFEMKPDEERVHPEIPRDWWPDEGGEG
jgi:hypothetical protein